MFKNITVAQLAIILTIFLALLNVSVFAVLYITGIPIKQNISFWSILILLSLAVSYLVLNFFLEKFVFRKIKLIYKIIHDSKRSIPSDVSGFSIYDQSIDKVNEEVEQWAKSTENEIEYLTKLETYRRSYLGNVSHELKTPIFTIQGYLHTLVDGGLYDDKINKKYLESAISNLERLENIVEDLEIINKLESGGVVLDIRAFDIKDLAEEVMADLSFMASEKNIQLKFKEGAARPYKVEADRENIRQVFTNLISNSIKYGNEGGITKVAFYDMADKILIEVSDNGIGIEEQHLRHLFDRFYRVDASRSRKQGGSGLGLSIVKHIIEAHQQSINVRSTPNIGSTFGFTLKKYY